ncbi:response regulator [Aurantibacter crassamenti]|uniref:hybrid sensor histidine kinase/response regulator transcription factor n=1 Tax=Aurantibacter crassamenti TaxID=1837375 RepID=UPI00193ABD8C|nr:hybrid sensor histidine kinase/response regulator transcription factor [Aurantibacter crassamenti]MBM1106789.1 response regulator [Aurantibacter crassamenti]
MPKGCLILFVFFWSVFCFPQFSDFQKYGVRDGLNSNTVFSTIEDKDGFIWIATEEGVDRFDGINFKQYTLPNLFEYRKVNDVVHYINIGSNNQIWVATLSGLVYKYNPGIDEFELFHTLTDIVDVAVQTFYIDHKNDLWFGTLNGTLVLHPETKFTRRIDSIKEKNTAITQDNLKRYYLATDVGIQVLDSSKTVLYDLLDVTYSKNMGIKGSVISSLFFDEINNRLWLGSNKLGLCAFNLVNFDFIKPQGFPKLKGIYLRSIERFSQNEIILGIDGEGLIIWNIEDQKVTKKISDEIGDDSFLNTKSVQHVFRNKAGVFFISTWRGGLNVYSPEMAKFQSISHMPNNENSITNNVVFSSSNIGPGIIGFGTDKGINVYNSANKTWQHLDIYTNNEKHISNAKSISSDKQGNIWATSYTDSLVLFKRGQDGLYYSTKDFPEELSQHDYNKVHVGDDGQIWLSDDIQQQITRYSIKDDTIENYSLISGQVQTLLDFSAKKLAIGTSSGLKIFDKEKRIFEDVEIIESSKLKTAMISSLAIDANKQLWVGTRYKGLFLINFFKNTVTRITADDGLISNRIFSVAAHQEDVWVSTSKGISKIDNKMNISHFSESDGIISIDFNYNVALLNNNQLYFGTNDGVIMFNPEKVYSTTSQKNLVFSEFYLNHKRVLNGENSPLKSPLNETEEINLNNDQSSFSIGFSSIDFIHSDQGSFQWKLENFDEDWIDVKEVTRASYTNLNPGKYIFKLRLLGQQQELIANERQLIITINPPFWQTYWAYLLYFLLAVLIMLLFGYLNTLRVKSKNAKEKLHYLVNIAHEIKTPLMLIKAPLTDLLNNVKMDSAMLQGIQIALKNTEKVNLQMVQFLDFRHFRLRKKTVINTSIDLIRFLNDKIFAFKILADKKNINLTFNHEIDEFKIISDEKILDKIVGNLLSNAIKYTNEGGNVSIKLIVANQKCKISVVDSGIGISKSQSKKIFKLFYRTPAAKESGNLGTGVGLVLAQDLAKMIEGKVVLEESSQKGSTFSFIFPFEKTMGEIENREENQDTLHGIEEPQTLPSIKVLIVEDDQELLAFSKKKLGNKYQVLTASDGLSALQVVKKEQPDIVISDVIMPKMNGLQLCMNLKKKIDTCHIPVILLTGLSSKENVIQGLESGADDYITKPYDYELLFSKMEGLLKNRSVLKNKFLIHDYNLNEIEFSNKLDDNFMNDLTQLVEENISDENFSIKDMCEAMGMSRTSFYHKIKGLIDISPNEFIRTIRLKKGMSMLLTLNYNVSEVAYNVGFSDAKYFGTLFKKYYGKSPSVLLAEKKEQSEQISDV